MSLDDQIAIGTCPAGSGTGTSTAGAPGAVSRSPSSVSVGCTTSSRFSSRAVTIVPAGSTTIQRRSCATPHGSTTTRSSDSPRHDLTG